MDIVEIARRGYEAYGRSRNSRPEEAWKMAQLRGTSGAIEEWHNLSKPIRDAWVAAAAEIAIAHTEWIKEQIRRQKAGRNDVDSGKK